MSEKYFIASNSAEGFCSYYDEVFDARKLSRIYIIKGGSGTGKAYFMREVAKCAEKKGFTVRYLYCSSDSGSLDGIIVKEPKIAVLDGTSPHIFEPRLIGAVEHFVDLSLFLDEKKLIPSRDIIEKKSAEKAAHFERAYRYLSAYRELSESIEELIRPAVKHGKLAAFAERFARGLEAGDGEEEHLLCRAVGMRGLTHYPTYFENASIYYEVNDYYDTAHFLMSALHSAFNKKRADLRLSPDPIMPERTVALCAVGWGLTFEVGNENRAEGRVVSMKRFTDAEKLALLRAEYREIARVRDGVLTLALAEFESVKKEHFILENIYGAAMDFEAKERFTENFCRNLF